MKEDPEECEICGDTDDVSYDDDGTLICNDCFFERMSLGWYDER